MGEFNRRKSITLLVSVVAIILGLVVMFVWSLHLPLPLSVLPGYVTMKFNTALFFVLAGSALCLNNINKSKHKELQLLSKVLAYTVFIGTVTLQQPPLNYNFGADRLFIVYKTSVAIAANQPFYLSHEKIDSVCIIDDVPIFT